MPELKKKYCKDCKNYQLAEHECFWHGARRPFKLACSDYKLEEK